ncbi:MAG: hypothetical protein A2633_04900 [Candidatus Sungbacteria bacterium RIFCSPHIGHO2_01_FULL_47_32]|uniref:PKD domain-containing protein n=1 Tax=Candidatus Sungbacteria bacterium RIFCSPHIGHO2_01_FULL_47_32 TaxID=1802264 RepID=A0A1G2K2Z6_9BACT|nr:MAG: hypothetical protein A2633_04900 [Candidatus Sungbacteria bacterium RIFCSPHIGHO2_01_FULL_47_32]
MKKLLPFFITAVILAGPALSWASVDPATIQALQAQIQELQEKIRALIAQGNSVTQTKPAFGGSTTMMSGSGSAGAGVTVSGVNMQAIFNDDTSNDDIIQLNNLRIQSIDAQAGVALITASNDFGINCLKFQDQDSTSGISFPCPMPLSILYQIKVDSDTRLLLRNRQKATLADFAVGDRINVYGFMDRASNAVTAVLVRNIDKPATKKFIQLNNVQVASLPDSTSLPTSFVVIQNGISPCFDYGEMGVGGKIFPCPLGLEMREMKMNISAPNSAGVLNTATAMSAYYPAARKYSITVTPDTKIIGSNRQPLTLKDISVGDTLNIYGSQSASDSTSISALIIRDLSKPVANERSVLRVAVTDASIMCMQIGSQTDALSSIMAPCGILYNATVDLYGSDGSIRHGSTERGVAVFENLKPGTYTAAASAPGYDRNKLADIRLDVHQIQTVTIMLQHLSSRGISVRALDNLNGSVGVSYGANFEASGGVGSYVWAISDGALPPGLSLTHPPVPMIACRVDGPCPIYPQNRILLSGTPTQGGTYKFRLTATDSQGHSGSETFIAEIRGGSVGGNLPPSIYGVTGPTLLAVGQQGTWTVKAADPENSSLSYAVVWGDESTMAGTAPSLRSTANDVVQTSTFTHSFAKTGTYAPVFIVTDNSGTSAKTTISVTVTANGTTPPVSAGYLQIKPASASVAVGGSVRMQAIFQPSMPPCPVGLACAQVMPAPYQVNAEWTSSNPGVASLVISTPNCAQGTNYCGQEVLVKGISNGVAGITAVYKMSSGFVLTAIAKVTVGSGSQTVTVISPNGGETWLKETMQTIKWQDNFAQTCPAGTYCASIAPRYYTIQLVPYYPPCTGSICPLYAIHAPYVIASSVGGISYNWSVGKVLNTSGAGDVAPDGSYTVQVCQTGTDICDSSDSYFKITSSTAGTTSNSAGQ